jgi:hypothetical protein
MVSMIERKKEKKERYSRTGDGFNFKSIAYLNS